MVEKIIDKTVEYSEVEKKNLFPQLDFSNETIWRHSFIGYKLIDREIEVELSIQRKENQSIEFFAFAKYSDTRKKVLSDNLAKYRNTFPFSDTALKEYVTNNNIILESSEWDRKYEDLIEIENKIETESKQNNNKKEIKSLLSRKEQIDIELNSLFCEEALKKIGAEWFLSLEDKLKIFIENDENDSFFPFSTLQSILRYKAIPKNSNGSMIPGSRRMPGSYGIKTSKYKKILQ